jgi:hypothetical protein
MLYGRQEILWQIRYQNVPAKTWDFYQFASKQIAWVLYGQASRAISIG